MSISSENMKRRGELVMLLGELKRLRLRRKIFPFGAGICHSIKTKIFFDLHYTWFKSWGMTSGAYAYPVPASKKFSEKFTRSGKRMSKEELARKQFYRSSFSKWIGEYGRNRFRLLDHCIAECESLLKEMTERES